MDRYHIIWSSYSGVELLTPFAVLNYIPISKKWQYNDIEVCNVNQSSKCMNGKTPAIAFGGFYSNGLRRVYTSQAKLNYTIKIKMDC